MWRKENIARIPELLRTKKERVGWKVESKEVGSWQRRTEPWSPLNSQKTSSTKSLKHLRTQKTKTASSTSLYCDVLLRRNEGSLGFQNKRKQEISFCLYFWFRLNLFLNECLIPSSQCIGQFENAFFFLSCLFFTHCTSQIIGIFCQQNKLNRVTIIKKETKTHRNFVKQSQTRVRTL